MTLKNVSAFVYGWGFGAMFVLVLYDILNYVLAAFILVLFVAAYIADRRAEDGDSE